MVSQWRGVDKSLSRLLICGSTGVGRDSQPIYQRTFETDFSIIERIELGKRANEFLARAEWVEFSGLLFFLSMIWLVGAVCGFALAFTWHSAPTVCDGTERKLQNFERLQNGAQEAVG